MQAHADAGLRTVFVHAGSARPTGDSSPPLTTFAAGLDASDRWPDARQLGQRIHAHAGTRTDQPGLGAMASMLGDDVTLIHCSDFLDTDLDAVASSGASVVVTPSSEMAGGLQPLQVQKLVDRGIRPGLGVDSEQRAPGDLFAQMRTAISLQHATLFDLKLAGKAGLPKLLTTREVIRYATTDGALAVALGDVTGSLTPGKQADVVVLRADRPNIYPINDPIGAVVWGMDTSNLDWVFVAGRALLRSGVLEADVERARELAAGARRRLVSDSATLRRGRVGGSGVTAARMPSSAVTSFVVASRYLPVYLALLVLVVVAAIWAPPTLGSVGLSAIAPYGALLAITASRADVGDHDRRDRPERPRDLHAGRDDHGGGHRRVRSLIGVALLTAIGVAALIGLVNGLLIGGLKLNPLIVTLAVGQVVIGLVNRYGRTFPVQSQCPPAYPSGRATGSSGSALSSGPAPSSPSCSSYLPLHRRRPAVPGRWRQPRRASKVVGVRVNLNQIAAYVVAAVFYALAGVALAGLLRSPGPTIGTAYLLGPIAAVVIGGASLTGGLASPLSTFAAAFFLTGSTR